MQKFLASFIFLLLFIAVGYSQNPTSQPTPPETDINVVTEEIKLSFSAVNYKGYRSLGLTKDDVVITENGRLHQAESVRQVPANVLFVLDVGNEISYAKRSRTTSETAWKLVKALSDNDSVAVMQYGDKVEMLSDWTKDKVKLKKVLRPTKLGYGKHSMFHLAMQKAIDFFDKTPLENRHLILITDGVDSLNNPEMKDSITRRLLSSDINVHVISYTILQKQSIQGKKVKSGGSRRSQLPPGAGLPEHLKVPSSGGVTINLDREMIRHRKKEIQKLENSEKFLTTLAKDTNGDIFLPETPDEMIENMARLASYIDSQYVLTYIPKNSLENAPDGEIRNIRVTSKKSGVYIQTKRKYVVRKVKE